MPSNKNKDKLKMEQLKKNELELTGKNEVIYRTAALMPELDEKNDVIYKVVEICFTADKKLVSMEEVDRCRTQGSAMTKLEIAFNRAAYNIQLLRKVVKELKKEQTDE